MSTLMMKKIRILHKDGILSKGWFEGRNSVQVGGQICAEKQAIQASPCSAVCARGPCAEMGAGLCGGFFVVVVFILAQLANRNPS